VWTFKLRPNVKFQSGETLTADDVVTTYNRLVDPKSGSQALSAYQGVLSPGGIKKVDAMTVQFSLDTPNANFPYLTSSTTYQAIILPAGYQVGTFTKKPQTTGGFQLTSWTPGVGVKYDRFPGWWGGTTPLDGVDVTFYSNDAAAVAALLAKEIDLIGQIGVSSARSLLNNSAITIYRARGATHRQVSIRVDMDNPLKDYRVRQALALTLDRPSIIKTLWSGLADLGNDSPFAPVFPSTDKSVPQRRKDLRKAKQLMAAAGFENGFPITLTTETVGEVPQLAQIIQSSARAIGINMKLNIMTVQAYFAGTQTGPPKGWGNTPWLNTPINITDWSHRAVPNVYLTSAFKSKGVWNASHYASSRFDSLAKSYVSAISLADQRKYERQMQLLLLRDTPIILPYFQNYLQALSKQVKGYVGDASGHVYLSRTSLA
jgi:peptide/nickel transport system substrate-binding protein